MSLYDDAPDFRMLSQVTRTARKPHECVLCDKPIQPGQTYRVTAYVEDGEFGVSKEHRNYCWRLAR